MDEIPGSQGTGGTEAGRPSSGRAPGPDIPGYQITEMIGRGAFGVVYRAWQPAFHRRVAIKVLVDALDDRDAARLLRECQALGTASTHPNIVTVHDAGFTPDGRGFLVMEYLGGGSLADAVARDGRMAWEDVARIGVRLAGALETAHRASVLHRDIKPDNVLLSDYGEPKLADFGIARLVGGTATRTGPVYASILYAAPEVLAGHGPSTPSSDVYALGGTLYTLVSGRPPFVPNEDEPVGSLISRIVSTPPDLRVPGAHPALLAVIGRALAKDPSARQATAEEFGEALRDVQREAGIAVADMPIGAPSPAEKIPEPSGDDPNRGVPWLAAAPSPPAPAPAPPVGLLSLPPPQPPPKPRRGRVLLSPRIIAAIIVATASSAIITAKGAQNQAGDGGGSRAGVASTATVPGGAPTAPARTVVPGPAPSDATSSVTVRKVSQVPPPARCAPGLRYGQTVTCSLGAAGDVRRHDFTAAAGDRVFARAVRVGGGFTLVPSVAVLGPDGASACPEPRDCAIKAPGRQTLVVQDMLKQGTGDYDLYLQRINDPAGCGAIAIGEAAEGTLEPVGAMGCAIFAAAAGDRVRVNAVGTRAGIPAFPELAILSTEGGGTACPLQEDCRLERGGRYVILASSSITGVVGQTGPYRITVTCLAGPCRGG